jgi:hypothetical protein
VQQSTRIIFHDLFKVHGSLEWKEGKMSDLRTLDLQNYWKIDEVDTTNCMHFSCFVSSLRLPADLVERFEMEWLRLCLCAYYTNAMMACSFTSDSHEFVNTSSDNESDDYEDDSEMEFW